MADIEMNVLKVGNSEFEIADAQARQDVSDLKEDKADIDSVYVTDTASGSIASFPDGADNVPVKSLKVNIEPVQSGSGDPSPDNVRPISGHTSAKVTRCGKNLFDWNEYAPNSDTANGYTKNDNHGTINGTYSTNKQWDFVKGFTLKPGTYTLSLLSTQETPNIRCAFYLYEHGTSTFVRQHNAFANGTSVTFTTDRLLDASGAISVLTAGTYDAEVRIQLELSSTVSDYKPYNGQTVTIDLNGTIYGGTLDVGTGVLTVDRALVDMGTMTWMLNGGYFKTASLDSIIKRPVSNTDVPQIICSIYSPVDWNTTADKSVSVVPMTVSSPNTFFWVKDTSYTDAASFKTAMNGVQLCYELAEPFTVQLTAQEVTTLRGQNNIWADTGDVDVEYRADTKLYINKVLNA